MMAAAPAIAKGFAKVLARAAAGAQYQHAASASTSVRLIDSFGKELVDDIFSHSLKKQTGVSLKYMLDFGNNPIDRQLLLSAQFLHKELPVRLAHRVAELENLPYGLSAKKAILQVRVGQGGRGVAGAACTHACAYSPAAMQCRSASLG
jgi:pyruvate dehydrogenase kinase 2/3/4